MHFSHRISGFQVGLNWGLKFDIEIHLYKKILISFQEPQEISLLNQYESILIRCTYNLFTPRTPGVIEVTRRGLVIGI